MMVPGSCDSDSSSIGADGQHGQHLHPWYKTSRDCVAVLPLSGDQKQAHTPTSPIQLRRPVQCMECVLLTSQSCRNGCQPSTAIMLMDSRRCSILAPSLRSCSSVPTCSTTPPSTACTAVDTCNAVESRVHVASGRSDLNGTCAFENRDKGLLLPAQLFPTTTPAVFYHHTSCFLPSHQLSTTPAKHDSPAC